MLLSLIKVRGHSMEPYLKEGSFFIGSSLPYKMINPKIADIILFKDKNKIIVKRIKKISDHKIWTEGINREDSKNFGPIEKKEILGKLIFKI